MKVFWEAWGEEHRVSMHTALSCLSDRVTLTCLHLRRALTIAVPTDICITANVDE